MITVAVSTKEYLALLQQDGQEWTWEGRQVPSGFTGWLNRAVMLFDQHDDANVCDYPKPCGCPRCDGDGARLEADC